MNDEKSWVDYVSLAIFIFILIENYFLQPKRMKKWEDEYKVRVLAKVVEELKKTDGVLVISENERKLLEAHSKLEVKV
jgi:hypothetical protein